MSYLEKIDGVPKKMRAVVAYQPGDYRLEEVDVPEIGEGEVLLKVGGCGICAGDVKGYHGAPSFWGGEGQPAWIKAPFIPGHEFYGQVVALGEGAGEKYGLKLGDWAVSEQIVPCGKCMFCLEGKYWMCEVHNIYGFQGKVADGAFAEYVRLPKTARNYKLPETFPLRIAPYVEPLGCAIHAVERADIQFRDVVVIAGLGALGLGMVQAVRLKNPKMLVAMDVKPQRNKLAEEHGADLVLNPLEEDVVSRVKSLTNGYGCDVYIQASGHPSGAIQGLQMIRKLGRFVEFSVYNDPVTVDWSIIGDRKELDLRGAHLSPYTYESAIRFLNDGRIKADKIITHELPLQDFKKGFEMVTKGEDSIKVVLIP
ncbi:MAG: alcohol dehydrogenase catalytic domain-containing protein [Atribacterota bacterium]|nr:alcohol dehydrogenase catalytic domain-containing protein [Atribacterota bacterium]